MAHPCWELILHNMFVHLACSHTDNLAGVFWINFWSVLFNDDVYCYVYIALVTDDRKCMKRCWNDIDMKNESTRRETCLTATLFNTNLAWAGPGSSPCLRGNRSAGSGRRLTVWGMALPLNKSTACRLVDLRESGSVEDKRPCRPPSLVTSPALANVFLHWSHAERRQNGFSADEMQPRKMAKVHGTPETFARPMNAKHRKKKDEYFR